MVRRFLSRSKVHDVASSGRYSDAPPHRFAAGQTRRGCYRARRMSAGRAAMWIIAGGIATALIVVLAVSGISGIPYEWWGLVTGAALASVAFGLGYVE
jgi:hypothetical protein